MGGLALTGAGPSVIASSSVVFTDDFNRANENLTTPWTRSGGAAADAQVFSNQLVINPSSESAFYVSTLTGIDDCYVELDFITTSIIGCFPLAARITDANNFVGARYSDTGPDAWEIYKRVGGTFTILGSSADTRTGTDRARLEVTGDNARLLVNDVEVIANQSLGGDLTSGEIGLIARALGGVFDNFEAGSL